MWTFCPDKYRQSLGLLHSGRHWPAVLGTEHVLQKQLVWWPKAVTKVEQKPAEEFVASAQFSAMSTPALVAQVKWTRGLATLVPVADAQTPLASMLPHLHAPLPSAAIRLHCPGPQLRATMPSCASHRTQVSPVQYPYWLTPWQAPPTRTQPVPA
ncbi:hypothetical protein [Myxococcus xanthus]|uniref:hypothetical protein n=1 Tax=Myxococcus xanthus TaxID=34 RepID=UPI00112DCABA|nr:hypothetical protein [Myxococcus xanthus]QDE83342.1 hypothetical protein BHS07_18240 [Myxococcus xanthus]